MPTRDHHKQLAAELADTAMALARDIAAKAMAAEAVEDKIALAGAYDRLARAVRLSIQLCEKLERPQAAEDAAGLTAAERAAGAKFTLRKAQVRDAVRRSIEQDYEGEDAELLEAALDVVLQEQALSQRFMDRPAGETVTIVRKILELPEHPKVWLPDLKPAQGEAAAVGAAGPS
jgi:hypothetical protein